jgi:hypothetical protein
MFTDRSWIAKVEGKKYYLLNIDEEDMAAKAIARILSHGSKADESTETETSTDTADTKVEDEVDVNVDVEA